MNSSAAPIHPEVQALTEANEALLKSKSQLQQNLLQAKKELAGKELELTILRNQSAVFAEQANLLEQKNEFIDTLTGQNKQLQFTIKSLHQQLEQLDNENTRLRKLTWYQKLLGKK